MYTLAGELDRFAPVVRITKRLSRHTLTRLRTLFFTLTLAGTTGVIVSSMLYPEYLTIAVGATLLTFGAWIEQILLFSYVNSYYYAGLRSLLNTTETIYDGATFEVAEIVLTDPHDVTKSFCMSTLGKIILLRSGVTLTSIDTYLNSARPKIAATMIPLTPDAAFTIVTLCTSIMRQDPSFNDLLRTNGVTPETFRSTVTWIHDNLTTEKQAERWWSRGNLSKTQGIGREWSYGGTFILDRYAKSLTTGAVFTTLGGADKAFTKEKIAEIEVALARAKASNVLVIGETGTGTIDLLLEVDRRIQKGEALGAVSGGRMILLDTTRLFATHNDKTDLEVTLLNLFTEATNAGNVIIVIENISNFMREAEAMGIFIPELLDPFLATSALHVIATDTPSAYHTFLEPLGAFTRRFAEVLIEAPSTESTIRVLQNIALATEARYGVLFTYPALAAVAIAAERHIVEGVMPDKAIELLIDVATRSTQSAISTIDEQYVYSIVSEKTGMPVGPIGEAERDTLLHLEDTLHARVIGQQPALDAIARTMRRARVGIESHDKPIGSFMFLGPTGVGKTETAKALAHVFFGSEGAMHRLDMSEFSGNDSLLRLLGDRNHSGFLPDLLRERPYAVLLLDEFEKAHRSVHDLFLQILDEGVFTDGRGGVVNARNTIIIATSNAGSALIIKTVSERKALATLHQEIINHIIETGVYRPELINRFDATIIFEPLTLEEQGQVAGLMLKGLYDRVKERGYTLTINQDLLTILVRKGYSPMFGARPMQRVLQDLVEEKVAEKIISGVVTRGDTISLTPADFTEKELA